MQLGQGTLVAGRYVVEKKIGEGAWGEVWLGHHAAVGMRVALKALREAKIDSHDAIVRFGREAKFLGRVQSDYVARVLDYIDDEVYGLVLVMEFVDGESLADLLEGGPISVERAIAIGRDVAAGLCDLHAARVVHRDLKPANVILRPLAAGGTRAVIIDFSLGRLVGRAGEEESSLTQLTGAAMAVGTLPYMSPEQILDSRKVTYASDIYALGSLLYRCVGGEYVFTGKEDGAVARRKLTAEAPPLETGRGDAKAKGLARVVARALRRRPEDRYVDARAMLDDLAALEDAEEEAAAPAHEPAPADERQRPSRALLALAGASLLGAGVAAGLALGHERWSRSAPATPPPIAASIVSAPTSADAPASSPETPTPTPTPSAIVVDDPVEASAPVASSAAAARALRPIAIDPPVTALPWQPPPRPSATTRASAPTAKPSASAPPSPYDEE